MSTKSRKPTSKKLQKARSAFGINVANKSKIVVKNTKKTNFLELPPQILSYVSSMIQPRDRSALRLACHKLADVIYKYHLSLIRPSNEPIYLSVTDLVKKPVQCMKPAAANASLVFGKVVLRRDCLVQISRYLTLKEIFVFARSCKKIYCLMTSNSVLRYFASSPKIAIYTKCHHFVEDSRNGDHSFYQAILWVRDRPHLSQGPYKSINPGKPNTHDLYVYDSFDSDEWTSSDCGTSHILKPKYKKSHNAANVSDSGSDKYGQNLDDDDEEFDGEDDEDDFWQEQIEDHRPENDF